MGYPMAGHATKAVLAAGGGAEFRVWNRTAQKAETHASEHGSRAVPDIAGFVGCRVLFTCLPNTVEVQEVAAQLKEAKQRSGDSAECLWVDCTSGEPAQTRALAGDLEHANIRLVDCPVSGGPRGAIAGSVTSMLGGSAEVIAPAMPLIEAFSGNIYNCGPVGAGMAVKAINNVLNATHLLIGTEALLALQQAGIDPTTALSVINTSSGRSFLTQVTLPEEVVSRRFAWGFKLGHMGKDCDIAANVLRGASIGADAASPSLLVQATDRVRTALAERGGEADYTELARWLEGRAGQELKPPSGS